MAELGVGAIMAVPLGRILIGPLTDRYGAPVTAGATLVTVPILVLCAWVFQPAVAERTTTGGWIGDEPAAAGGSVASSDD